MSDLRLRVVRRAPLPDTTAASQLAVGIQRAVSSVLGAMQIWASARSDRGVVGAFLLEERATAALDRVEIPQLGPSRFVTHSLSLRDARRGGRRLGGLTLGVGAEVTGPGLVLGLTLPTTTLDRAALRLVRAIADLDVSEVTVGPAELVAETHAGAFAFAQRVAEPGDVGRVEPTSRGYWLIAHDEPLRSVTPKARAAIERLARAVPMWRAEPQVPSRGGAAQVDRTGDNTRPDVAAPTYLMVGAPRGASMDRIDETGILPPDEELRRLIEEADPRVAIPSAARARGIEQRARVSMEDAGSGETAMMPAPAEVLRLIDEADPARAMARGAGASAGAAVASDESETIMMPATAELQELIKEAAAAPTVGAAAASGAARAARAAAITLDDYAAIRAATTIAPAEVDAIWARYAVGPSERLAVEARLMEQIAASPEGGRRFEARVAHLVALGRCR